VRMTSGAKRTLRTSAAGAGEAEDLPGADPDGDGVPSTFDADDNGNKTLDGVDPATAKTSTAGLFSDVQVMMARSVNANAGGIGRAQIDAFVKNNTSLNFYLGPSYARGAAISSVDVDCGTLAYCRRATATQPWATAATRRRASKTSAGPRWTKTTTASPTFPSTTTEATGRTARSTRSRSSPTRRRRTCTPAISSSCASPPRAAC
jgi:hypothetical protein